MPTERSRTRKRLGAVCPVHRSLAPGTRTRPRHPPVPAPRTSMATPITSGIVAVARQYLRQRRGVADPSAALMKALVINAAGVPAGASTTPDNTRGFGWLEVE